MPSQILALEGSPAGGKPGCGPDGPCGATYSPRHPLLHIPTRPAAPEAELLDLLAAASPPKKQQASAVGRIASLLGKNCWPLLPLSRFHVTQCPPLLTFPVTFKANPSEWRAGSWWTLSTAGLVLSQCRGSALHHPSHKGRLQSKTPTHLKMQCLSVCLSLDG